MNLLNILNIKNSSNLDIVKVATIKNGLHTFLSPKLAEMGLIHWDKNYRWSSDYNQYGIKHVFEYVYGKGISGTFQYGNVFNFIPSFSDNGKIKMNDKHLQLFERAKGWHESFETSNRTTEYSISHWNEHFFKKSIRTIFNSEENQITDWFKLNQSIEENIKTGINQINKGGAYNLNSPDQKFILAFLYAKNGESNLAKNMLLEYYNPLIKLNDELRAEFECLEKMINEI
jgi:hypothetical protein